MTVWQRRIRLALGVFVLLFAGGVYLAMRRQPQPPPPRPDITVDPRVQTQVSRGTQIKFNGANVDWTIDYQTVLEYSGDATKIRGVKANFPNRNGRDLQVTGDEASVAQDQSSFAIRGNVRFTSSDGLVLTTQQASYTSAEGIVRSPGKVEFQRGATRGSGVGMTYDQKREIVTFADQFEMTSEQTEDQPASEVHAGSAVWARNDKMMRFERSPHIVRGGQTLDANLATAHLTPDEQHVQVLEMQGNARITGAPSTPAKHAGPPPASALRAMRANNITLTYASDGQKLQQAVLAGTGSVEVASAGSGAITRIAGDFLDFGLEPDGTTMQSVSARAATPASRAQLDLPAQDGAPPRVIQAASIQGPTPGKAATPGGGLTTLRFTDNVEYRETPTPPAAARVATARGLDVVMQPGFGALEDARFSGGATLREGTTLEASARDARYDVKAGTFEFTGADDLGRLPRVKDQDQATIQGTRIVVTPDNRKVAASGNVQTTIQPAQKRADGTSSRTPGILAQDQPALATSDALDYDGAASHAVFTSKPGQGRGDAGQSRLWQAQGNSIYGATIVVDDAKGDLTAKGSVVSTIKLQQTDAKTKRKETVNSTVRADMMVYEDARHQATYTGHVQMKGGQQGDLKADRVVLFLTATGDALERLEAYDNVDMQDPGTEQSGPRRTTGDRLTYLAADESYKVTGKLVKITEQCYGESVGHTLIFNRSDDRMILDGNMKRRTQTKGGQGCK